MELLLVELVDHMGQQELNLNHLHSKQAYYCCTFSLPLFPRPAFKFLTGKRKTTGTDKLLGGATSPLQETSRIDTGPALQWALCRTELSSEYSSCGLPFSPLEGKLVVQSS